MLKMREPKINHFLITFLAAAGFFGSTEIGHGQATNNSAADTYKANCVSCHGSDGHGSAVGKSLNAPDFHSPEIKQQSDAQLTAAIKNGKGNMPPFGDKLSDAQIAAVVKYVRTFGKAK